MVDFESLDVGDVVSVVSRKINYGRQRITMVDNEGVEWHRYNIEINSFEVQPFTLAGIVKTRIIGEINPDESYRYSDDYDAPEYHLRSVANKDEWIVDDGKDQYMLFPEYFTNETEAYAYVDTIKEKLDNDS